MTRPLEATPINWSAPIEAVHEDGRVAPMVFDCADRMGRYLTKDSPSGDSNIYWNADGSDYVRNSGWAIRNVAPATETAPTAPSGGEVGSEVGVGTWGHGLGLACKHDPVLWDRMVMVIREYATGNNDSVIERADGVERSTFAEARAIVALLPEPVDADEVLAVELTERKINLHDYARKHPKANHWAVQLTLMALKEGRALAKGEAA